jgi:hypothetical protein
MRLIRGFAPIARDEAAGDVIAETLKIRRSGTVDRLAPPCLAPVAEMPKCARPGQNA